MRQPITRQAADAQMEIAAARQRARRQPRIADQVIRIRVTIVGDLSGWLRACDGTEVRLA